MNKKIEIVGRKVQGVGYRLFLFEKAQELCIPNFHAQNIGTNRVVAYVGGDKEQVSEFLKFVKKKYPKGAKVSRVIEKSRPPNRIMPIDAFAHLLQANQLGKGVKTIQSMDSKLQSIDGKQDQMLNKQDQMLGKQDQMLNKQDKTVKTLDKFRVQTNKNFHHMDGKYGRIAENMEKMLVEMKGERKDFRKSVGRLVKAILASKTK